MDPNLHHTPLHWGYTSTPTQNHWTPPQTRSVKRALSESDCEELYSEESSKEHVSPESDGCHLLSRKKRRGVIEKKRRDRINSSLSELKRLVPSAYEKQGSAKLEKAEILQLTVEHLKSLHAKGLDSMAYDPQRFAMDYHIIGFRECASEVARYLVTIEGMDIQDPLRLRLMSHLQYFVQQRELSAKACSSPNWTSTSYQANCTPPTYQAYPTQTASSSNAYIPNLPPPIQPIQPTYHHSTLATPTAPMHHHHGIPHSSRTSATTSVTETSSLMAVPVQHQAHLQQQHPQQQVSGSASQQLSPSHDPHQHQQQQQQSQQPPTQHYPTEHDHPHHDHQATRTYIDLTANDHQSQQQTADIAAGYASSSQYHTPTTAQGYNPSDVNYNGNGAKPYRPWGAEMAY